MRLRLSLRVAVSAIALCVAASSAHATPVEESLRGLAPSSVARISEGDPAAPDAWPWQVFLVIPVANKSPFICGGSLIAPRWVLTAGHCFLEYDAGERLAVFEGVERRIPGGAEAAATHWTSEVHVHPEFSADNLANDVALLHLAEPAIAQNVSPLLEASSELENPPRTGFVTGFGVSRRLRLKGGKFFDPDTGAELSHDALSQSLPERLLQAELPLVDLNECKARHSQGPALDARNICAGLPQGGKDACKGDSGGPLMTKQSDGSWRQIGVVSWSEGCGMPNVPGVYTRVSAFAPFIKSLAGRDLGVAPEQQPPAPTPDPAFDNAAGVAISFDQGDHVRLGERVAYRVTTRQAGYLLIFDAAPDGKLTQIFPNARSLQGGAASLLLTPERPLLIPNYRNPYRGFDVRVSGERGKGVIVAVLSEEPLTSLEQPAAPKTFASSAQALASISRLREELSRSFKGARGVEKPKYSIDIHEYFVE